MIERQVLPLKHWVTLLCTYSVVEDPAHESSEVLDASKVAKRVRGFVSSRVIVAAECAVEVFLATSRPNLVSRPSSFSLHCSKVVG